MKKFIIGNWKMHHTRSAAAELIRALLDANIDYKKVDCGLAPVATSLATASELLKGSSLSLGGQNCHFATHGAYTGEISATLLKDAGCDFVLLGHSERRTIFGETDELIAQKVKAVLDAGLTPVLCVGESLELREAGKTFDWVKQQIARGLAGVSADKLEQIVLAYEPIWAIGTGRNATAEQAEEVHQVLRAELVHKNTRILYGGSVKSGNAASLLAEANIDGLLVGGASLQASEFTQILRAAY